MPGGAPPPEVRKDYLESYAGDRFVESARYVRTYPTELPKLAEKLPGIETPVQIVCGRDDPLVPTPNQEFLHDEVASQQDGPPAGRAFRLGRSARPLWGDTHRMDGLGISRGIDNKERRKKCP